MPHIISKNIKPIAIIWLSRENTLFSSWAFFWKTPLGNEEEQGVTDRVSLWLTHPRSHFHFSHWNLSLCFFIVKVFKLWELLKWRAASWTPTTGSKNGGFSTPTAFYTHTLIRKQQTTDSDPRRRSESDDDPASVQLQSIRSRVVSVFHGSCCFFLWWWSYHIFNSLFDFWEWSSDINKRSLRMSKTSWYWIGKNC